MLFSHSSQIHTTYLEGLENSKALIVAYQKEDFMQKAAASVINNQIIPNGKLPVSVNTFFKYGDGE
jgi:beta-N-acetylhexosaminidase